MGLLGGIQSAFKKSEAAVIVQNLLELQVKAGTFSSDPAFAANRIIEAVWTQRPDLFNGKFGHRPHKLSVAAAALAFMVANGSKAHPNRAGFVMALATILNEFDRNGRLYDLNGVDEVLLEEALAALGIAADNLGSFVPPRRSIAANDSVEDIASNQSAKSAELVTSKIGRRPRDHDAVPRNESPAEYKSEASDQQGVAIAVALVGTLIAIGVAAFYHYSKAPITTAMVPPSVGAPEINRDLQADAGKWGKSNTAEVDNRLGTELPADQSATPRPTAVPSFDCQRTTNGAEALVCEHEELAVLDLELAEVYTSFLSYAASPEAVRADQRDWLHQTRDLCDSVDCLRATYESRIAMFRRALSR